MNRKTYRRIGMLPLLIAALQLAACGDGGGSSSGASPSPTPSPTSSPGGSTKTPPPYGPGAPGGIEPVIISPLSTTTSFGGALVGGNFFSLPATSAILSNAYLSYDAAANVYTLKNVPTDRNRTVGQTPDTTLPSGSPDPTEARNLFHEEASKLYVDGLDYVTHTGRGKVYAYAAVAGHGYISTYTSVNGDVSREAALAVFGFPTAFDKWPTSGTRTYVLDGFDLKSDKSIDPAAEVHDLGGSGWTITLTVDFGAGTFVLSGRKSVTTDDANWTYVDTGTIDANGSFLRPGVPGNSTGGFYGYINVGTKRDMTPKPGNTQPAAQRTSTFDFGTFGATFFGPGAEEVGLAFQASGKIVSGTATWQGATRGAFLGRSQ